MFNIIIPVFNKFDLTKKCIESVRKWTNEKLYRIFLIDDASTDETVKWVKLQSPKEIICFKNKENSGYVYSTIKGVNEALKISQYPFMFILNNDVEIQGFWTDDAIALFSNEKVAAIGAYGHKELNGNVFDFISGSRLIVRTEVVKKMGFYDPKFQFGYWEDVEYSWRLLQAGYKIAKFPMLAHHLRCATFRANRKKKLYYYANRDYFLSKVIVKHGEAKH